MKKILLLVVAIFAVPIMMVLLFLNKVEEQEFDLQSNITVKVKRQATSEVEEISFEEYIVGVVASEMPVSFQTEALKAQAVAARSYALSRMETDMRAGSFDLVDSTAHQVYKDEIQLRNQWGVMYAVNINKVREAVNSTKNEYLLYDNQVVDALYFSTSNGYTENSEDYWAFELPYLRSVESNYEEELSPYFITQKILDYSTFLKSLGLENNVFKIDNISRTDGYRIENITINGTEFTGKRVRELLGLKSSDFVIEKENDEIIITVSGFGHGIGMSQYGAEALAKIGYSYEEILKHYYTDVEIKKLP